MEMTNRSLSANATRRDCYMPCETDNSFGPEFSLLSVISRLERLVGLQQKITLCADNPKEMVRALRFHPRYEHFSMKELLTIVRKRLKDDHSMAVKLSEKLVPVYSAVLQAEGIGVEVLEAWEGLGCECAA